MHLRSNRAGVLACALFMFGLAQASAQAPGPYFAADQARMAGRGGNPKDFEPKGSITKVQFSGSSPISAMVARAAEAHGVPVRVALAVMAIESGGRCGARNRSAIGLFQVLPRTARSVGVYGSLADCINGAEAGLRYLSLIIRAHGVSCSSISLFNIGAAARPRCTSYGRRAMSWARM